MQWSTPIWTRRPLSAQAAQNPGATSHDNGRQFKLILPKHGSHDPDQDRGHLLDDFRSGARRHDQTMISVRPKKAENTGYVLRAARWEPLRWDLLAAPDRTMSEKLG